MLFVEECGREPRSDGKIVHSQRGSYTKERLALFVFGTILWLTRIMNSQIRHRASHFWQHQTVPPCRTKFPSYLSNLVVADSVFIASFNGNVICEGWGSRSRGMTFT